VKISHYLPHARTGHFDYHFSTAFKQTAGLAHEVLPQENQRGFGIVVHQDADRFNEFFILQNQIDGFFHDRFPQLFDHREIAQERLQGSQVSRRLGRR
jgi:hypothetical protein